MKKLAIALAAVIALLLIAVIVVPNVIPWKMFEPRIAAAVREATGRELRIDGDLDVSIFSDLGFRAEGVRLSNVPGASEPDMLALGSVTGKVRLVPLLGGRVVVDELVVRDPVIHLEVAPDGRPNWVFEEAGGDRTGAARPPAEPDGEAPAGLPVKDLSLADVRLENGVATYRDARTGQTLDARQINLALALPELARALSLTGGLTLNGEPVTLALSADSPAAMLAGERTALKADVTSAPVRVSYDGAVQQRPVAGLDGSFGLDVPSTGRLLAWLDRPLADGQPDPGPLKVEAVLTAAGPKVSLERATVEGSALQLRATGSFDGSGEVSRLVLDVEGGILDIDAYLPPPPVADGTGTVAAAEQRPPAERQAAPAAADPLAALSDVPFDLTPLRQTEADVRVAINGIRAMGYEVGRLALTAGLQGGVLQAKLDELWLYDGNVTGDLRLDGTGDALGADVALNIDKVDVGALSRAAAAGGEAPKVAGVASGTLRAAGKGASPRALAASLSGGATLDLGGVAAGDVPAGTVSDLRLALDLPGLDGRPNVKASGVYNREKVGVDLTLDPLRRVLSGEKFAVKADVTSAPVTVRYDGAVQQSPVAGLDGNFALEVPSVGRLLAWLEQPLADGQPDPGPLKVEAVLAAAGPKVGLERATVEGKALKLEAAGSVDASAQIPRFDADVKVVTADLDAYLPPSAEPGAAPADGAAGGPAPAGEPGGWSEEPFDFGGLKQAEGEARVEIGDVRYRGLAVRRGVVTVALAGGVLKTAVEGMRLAQGTIGATATVDASGPVPALAYQATVSGVQARPLLRALADTDRLSGTAEFEARGRARGRNQRELVESLGGDGRFKFLNGAVHGINIAATLRQARTLGVDASAREAQKTDFAELGGSFVIASGVLENRDLSMLAPLVRLTGEGRVPLPARTIDYHVVANLVPTLKGQGGKDALAGLPIPTAVKGSWDDPAYGVEWKGVFQEMAKDPERLANLPQDLRQVGQSLGVNLRLPDLPAAAGGDVGKVLEALPGIVGGARPPGGEAGAATGDGAAGAAVNVLRQLTEPKGTQPAARQPAAQPQQQARPQAQQQQQPARTQPQPQKPAVEDVVKGLTKGLFGN